MIFALYHSAGETMGLMENIVKKLGLPLTEVHLYDGEGLPRDVSDLDGLVVMGGPMNVDEVSQYPFLLPEAQLIEKVLSERKPVLGVCLGAQLMAKALGSRVYPHHTKEVGWHPLEKTPSADVDLHFGLFPKQTTVLHWHGDTFDLPKGATQLAKTNRCDAQAFRWGNNAYALQFHLEVTPAMLKGWCNAESEQGFIKAAGEDPAAIMAATPKAFEKLQPIATNFFTSYFKHSYAPLLATVV